MNISLSFLAAMIPLLSCLTLAQAEAPSTDKNTASLVVAYRITRPLFRTLYGVHKLTSPMGRILAPLFYDPHSQLLGSVLAERLSQTAISFDGIASALANDVCRPPPTWPAARRACQAVYERMDRCTEDAIRTEYQLLESCGSLGQEDPKHKRLAYLRQLKTELDTIQDAVNTNSPSRRRMDDALESATKAERTLRQLLGTHPLITATSTRIRSLKARRDRLALNTDEIFVGRDLYIYLVEIPSGEVALLNPNNKDDTVTLKFPRSFFISQCEITVGQWAAVLARGQPNERTRDHAKCGVKYDQLPDFFGELERKLAESRFEGWTPRLPTEGEWVYALEVSNEQLGATVPADWCDGLEPRRVSCLSTQRPEGGSVAPVDTVLYEMLGNVSKWCEDDWAASYKPSDLCKQATSASGRSCNGGETKVVRGGSFDARVKCAHGTCRGLLAAKAHPDVGFRIVLEAPR